MPFAHTAAGVTIQTQAELRTELFASLQLIFGGLQELQREEGQASRGGVPGPSRARAMSRPFAVGADREWAAKIARVVAAARAEGTAPPPGRSLTPAEISAQYVTVRPLPEGYRPRPRRPPDE